jgi:ABC-type antimicrobial peptide transport system permease subunit
MAVPIKYNLRNLRVRWVTTLMTIGGIGLVAAIFVILFAMAGGIDKTLVGTGHPRELIVLRKGSTSESVSTILRQQVSDVLALEGIEKDAHGHPMVSPELIVVANVVKMDGGKSNVAIRGVTPMAKTLRENLKIVEGRWFQPNLGEIVVGKGAKNRFAGASVGDEPFIRGRKWKIVGVFEAEGQSFESEIWGDIDDIKAQFKREYSSLIVRCVDAGSMERLARLLKDDKQIQLEAKPHIEYYKDQNMMAKMFRTMGVLIAIVLAVGAVFGAANTMYAAVASRTREIATMRVLGYSRFAILLSFMTEAAILGTLGGMAGSVFALVTLNGVTTGSVNWATFTELAFQFRVTPELMVTGTILSLVMGVVGGFLPALRASRLPIQAALRGL